MIKYINMPRASGKTTIVRELMKNYGVIGFSTQYERDITKFMHPDQLRGLKNVVIDEAQFLDTRTILRIIEQTPDNVKLFMLGTY